MGSLIGAAIAGGIALYTAYSNSEAAADAKKKAREAADSLKGQYEQLISDVEKHYDKSTKADGTYVSDDMYADALEKLVNGSNTSSEESIRKFYSENGLDGKFDYDKEISDFLDPRAEVLKEQAGRKAQASAAGGGMGRSYDGARAIGDAITSKDEELYKNALTEYNTDRTQKYNEWNSYLTQKQNELTQILNGQQNDLNNAKTIADMYRTDQDSEWQDIMNARIAAMNAGMSLEGMVNNTGNYTTDIGGMAQMISAGANVGDKAASAFSGGSGSM